MIMMKIIREFRSQILSPDNKVTNCVQVGRCIRAEALCEGRKVKSALPLAPKSSLIPPCLCCDVMLATLPNGSSTGSPLIVGQEMNHYKLHLGNSLLLRDFFPPKTFILRSSSFKCFNDITRLTEFPEVLQRFTLVILCVDYPLQLFLLYCRCTLRLFLVYLNSCIYKGGDVV